MIEGAVYLLCAFTSLACTVLLCRGYWRTGARLLLWSAICFAGLTLENVLLYVDLVVMPDVDLHLIRKLPGLIALCVLVFGLIWESK